MMRSEHLISGMFFQDGLTGSAWGDWSLYTASPLRAEPVSAAAAAAAAAKDRSRERRASGRCAFQLLTGPWQAAAAAKGATATTSAVAGASGAGSLSKGDGVAGKKGPSPSFDPSTQIGAMAPLGFFDPAGLELQLSRRDVSLPLSPRRIQQEGR